MPKVEEAYLEQRRDLILQAALQCFARQGFRETTIEDICREAGVSRGALYWYFPSKEDIVQACAENNQQRIAYNFPLAKESDNAAVLFEEYVSRFIRHFDQQEDPSKFPCQVYLLAEALRNPQINRIVQWEWQQKNEFWENLIQEGQRRGQVSSAIDPTAMAQLLLAMAIGLSAQKALGAAVDAEKCVEAWKSLCSGSVQTSGLKVK